MPYTGKFQVFEDIIKEIMIVYKHDNRPWLIGYSGGKDSTLLVSLVYEAMQRLKTAGSIMHKKIYIITSDTMVENPIVKNYMHASSNSINTASERDGLKIEANIIYPEPEQTFWSRVIGLGYPTPEPPGFRWCTERLKINPMNKFVNERIEENGEIIILLGVRKGESLTRMKTITAREIEGKLLNMHNDIPNAYVYNAITEVPNELVWEFLLKDDCKSPWDTDMKYLFNLYKGEHLSEEQSVLGEVDREKIPVTGNSRFGCWCCTMVKEDKSLQNFIERGATELIPLRNFRNELLKMRDNPQMRDNKRRNGTVYKKADGSFGLGPFTLEARRIILEKLLMLENETGLELITISELKAIDKMWDEEGDLSCRKLVDTYYKVKNVKLPWDDYKVSRFDIMAEVRVEKAEDEYKEIENLIISIDEELAALEKIYAKGGGISKKEWKSMQDQIAKEEIRRDERRKWLKDVANNVLPFIIVNQQLECLKSQIQLEHKAQIDSNMKSTIDTPEIRSIIENILSSCRVEPAGDITKKIIAEIGNYASTSDKVVPILNLSDLQRYELNAKINSLISFDVARIKRATDDIDASLRCVKRIRKKMEKSSVDNYDEYLQKKVELNERKADLSKQLLELDKELQKLRADKAVSTSKLAKAKADYEIILKKQSINDISARALLAFNELQEILYTKSIATVEKSFTEHFKALINKSDLIDGIHIDNNLNVLPYKNKHFIAKDIKRSLIINGAEYIIAQIGLPAFELLQTKLDSEEVEFDLPVEVKQQLSAGEKQIFVMALYQALSGLNKINVPYIIDTPFARIDKEHRGNILEHFFKKLKGQVIILSTDEEIVSNYMGVVTDVISDTFILSHTATGNTEILANKYFGVNNL